MEVPLWCNGMTPSSKEIRISYYGAGRKKKNHDVILLSSERGFTFWETSEADYLLFCALASEFSFFKII
jgi:hypothetical protein